MVFSTRKLGFFMHGLPVFQLVNLGSVMPGLLVFQLINLGSECLVCRFLTRKTCLFSMLPNGFSIRKRMVFKM